MTSLSWIPSEAITGGTRMAFDAGFTRYDDPPPDQLGDLEELRTGDRFRFANVLSAWVEVDDAGNIADSGYAGGGLMGSTAVHLGGLRYRFQAVQLPDLQREPERGDGWVRFTQTTGGRTGLPAPRQVRHPPYVQWQAPLVWTTLTLTLHASGRAQFELTGASRFPRHWVFGADRRLSHKSGLTDFRDWYRQSSSRHSPWGEEDSPALVTTVETALERSLSMQLMHGAARPRIQTVPAGQVLVRQGEPGTDVFLVLDGVVRVERDGEQLAEFGPGALLGERARLEGGRRTSTLVAVTACRLAAVEAGQFRHADLEELSGGHRHEDVGEDLPDATSFLRHARLDGRTGSAVRPVRRVHLVRSRRSRRRDRARAYPGRGKRPARGDLAAGRKAVRRRHPALAPALGSRARAAVLRRRGHRRVPSQPAAARAGGRRQCRGSAGAQHVAAALSDPAP